MLSPVIVRAMSFELPDGRALFNRLDLALPHGVTALVGPNGVGKTTLARLLAGTLSPSSGHLVQSVPVTLFPQSETPPPVTVDEYLAGHDYWNLADRARREALLEGVDTARRCDRLSGGQWMRTRLAAIPDDVYLILDEPTNDLDASARDVLGRTLQARREGTLLISHDRAVLSLCANVVELSNRGAAFYGGGWEAYGRARDAERAGLAQAAARAERERDLIAARSGAQRERQARRNRQGAADAARGGQAKILLGLKKRAAEATTARVDTDGRARAEEGVRRTREALEALKTDPVLYARLRGRAVPGGKLVLEAAGFNVRHAGAAEWLYPADLTFAWRGGARVALRGRNGSGKSTLLRALTGSLAPAADQRGRLRRGELAALVLDQTCSILDPGESVCGNMMRLTGLPENEVRNRLAGFLFTGEGVFQNVGTLSGGERLRAALAAGLLGDTAPELLVLDEPTNNLDLPNIRMLESLVAGFGGAVIAVSHDEAFLDACDLTESFMVGDSR